MCVRTRLAVSAAGLSSISLQDVAVDALILFSRMYVSVVDVVGVASNTKIRLRQLFVSSISIRYM